MKPAALPFFGDAYLADTTHLTTEEHGAYFLLMLAAWRQADCALPDDDRKLARIAGVSAQKWRSMKATLMDFWTLENGRYHQARLSKEHAWVREKSRASSKSAKARWSKQGTENKGDGGMRTHCDGNAPPPPPSKSKDLQPDGVADQVWFDFVAHRKRKRADITPTAMAGIASQAAQAGWSIGDALAEIVERGWVGFKADWVEKRDAPRNNDNPKSPTEWLTYCEEQVRKWRQVGDRKMIDEWQGRERAARERCGVVVPIRAVNADR